MCILACFYFSPVASSLLWKTSWMIWELSQKMTQKISLQQQVVIMAYSITCDSTQMVGLLIWDSICEMWLAHPWQSPLEYSFLSCGFSKGERRKRKNGFVIMPVFHAILALIWAKTHTSSAPVRIGEFCNTFLTLCVTRLIPYWKYKMLSDQLSQNGNYYKEQKWNV